MAAVRSYEDLIFWQLSEKLREQVFKFCSKPRVARHCKFCEDIRDSARSAPANISEGFARFRPRDNAKFVLYALGSLAETKNHLTVAFKEHYIDEDEFRTCWRLASRAIGAGNGYHAYLRSCPADGPHTLYDAAIKDAKQPASEGFNIGAKNAPETECDREMKFQAEPDRKRTQNPSPEPEPRTRTP
jgi:four helix bundle protein